VAAGVETRQPPGVVARRHYEGEHASQQGAAIERLDLQARNLAAREEAGGGVQKLVQGNIEPPAGEQPEGRERQPTDARIQAAVEAADCIAEGKDEELPKHWGDSI